MEVMEVMESMKGAILAMLALMLLAACESDASEMKAKLGNDSPTAVSQSAMPRSVLDQHRYSNEICPPGPAGISAEATRLVGARSTYTTLCYYMFFPRAWRVDGKQGTFHVSDVVLGGVLTWESRDGLELKDTIPSDWRIMDSRPFNHPMFPEAFKVRIEVPLHNGGVIDQLHFFYKVEAQDRTYSVYFNSDYIRDESAEATAGSFGLSLSKDE